MIGKNEHSEDSDEINRIKIITEKKKLLEENASKIRAQVTNCFDDLKSNLELREKQLLRQIEAIHNQQLSIVQSNWELVCSQPLITVNLDGIKNFQDIISKFGKIELPDKESIIVKNLDPYKVQEYEDANKDIVNFNKSINIQQNDNNIIIKLSDLQYTKDLLIQSNNGNLSDLKTSASNNFTSNLINPNLIIKNNQQLNARVEEKPYKIDNNHCSLLCSLSQNSNLEISHDQSQSIDDDISNSSSCSSKIEAENFEKTVTSTSCENSLQENDRSNNDNFEQITEKFIDIDSKVNNSQDRNLTDEHPKQIQQWLQHILTESETEPTIQEAGQFTEISKFHYNESSLET